MLRGCTIASVAVFLALRGGGPASASNYFVNLSALDGYTAGSPYGVNSSGAVTGLEGKFPAPDSTSHAFLYTGGSMYNIGPYISSSVKTWGAAINDSGQIAAEQFPHGYLYTGGTAGTSTELLWPGWTTGGLCYTINNAGQVGGLAATNTEPRAGPVRLQWRDDVQPGAAPVFQQRPEHRQHCLHSDFQRAGGRGRGMDARRNHPANSLRGRLDVLDCRRSFDEHRDRHYQLPADTVGRLQLVLGFVHE